MLDGFIILRDIFFFGYIHKLFLAKSIYHPRNMHLLNFMKIGAVFELYKKMFVIDTYPSDIRKLRLDSAMYSSNESKSI